MKPLLRWSVIGVSAFLLCGIAPCLIIAAEQPTSPTPSAPQPPQSPKVAELIDALKAKNAVDQRILNAMGAIVQETGQIPALQKQVDDLTKARDGASRGLAAESVHVNQLTQQNADLQSQVKALTARLAMPKPSGAQQRAMQKSGGLTSDQGQPLHLEPPAHR